MVLLCVRDSCVLGWSIYLLLSPLMSLQSLFASERKLIVFSVSCQAFCCCVLISASMSVFSCCMRVIVSCVGVRERRCFLICIMCFMFRVKVGL